MRAEFLPPESYLTLRQVPQQTRILVKLANYATPEAFFELIMYE